MMATHPPAGNGAPPLPSTVWAYFLDVDGTLIDIADTPGDTRVDQALLALISQLYRSSGGAVALVSGRALGDLQRLLGSLRLPMAGQHGLERMDSCGHIQKHMPPPAYRTAIREALAPVLARHPGLLFEDKGLTLALHYRMAPRLAAYVHALMGRFAGIFGRDLELQRGKRVVELKPAGIDKGTAVADYLAEAPFRNRRPVFIGDDVSDEKGFAAVNQRGGVSIKVGAGRSCARFRLPDVAAVHAWLEEALKGGR